jgi:hypothetical protein
VEEEHGALTGVVRICVADEAERPVRAEARGIVSIVGILINQAPPEADDGSAPR